MHGTASLLTDTVNGGRTDLDPHDRLRFSGSYQAEMNHGCPPVASYYAGYLKRLLAPLVGNGIPLWPSGRRAVIGLSHDVDRLDKWSELRGAVRTGKHFRDGARSVLRNAIRSNAELRLFREVLDHEHSLGFKSTFMFAATSRYDPGASVFDVAYSINSRTVRSAMEYVLERGFEIGLHASYNAHRSMELFVAEKALLSKSAGSEVNGLRHHFWHMGRDVERTLSYHEQAGFLYDTSVAWNEQIGFRRSTASPYFPLHSADQKVIRVLQLPVCVMDGNLFYKAGMSVGSAMEHLASVVNQLLECGGVGVVDWHSDTSHPKTAGYGLWGQCYREFLRHISDVPGLWVTNLGEIASWVRDRDRQLAAA